MSHGGHPGGRRRFALGEGGSAYLFLLPWLVGFVGLTAGPMLASLYLSFTDYNLLTPPRWSGLGNYTFMFFDDDRFRQSLKVTFFYVALSVPLKLAFALALAMVLNRGLRGLTLYRALFYVPSLLGASVAISVLWRRIFSEDGLVNAFIWQVTGIDGPNWLSNPDTSIYTLIILSIWQFGSPMIIFLAGLRAIPTDIYEAASVEGASPSRQFFKLTLPLLGPVIFFNLVIQTIESFKAFTHAFVISGGTGGPIDSTLFYTLYLYQEAFAFFRMGYASALAWVLLAIIAALTAIAFLSARFWVHYEIDDRR